MFTIDDLIALKEDDHDIFETGYQFVFMNIQNLIVSKLDGEKRAADFIKNYDNDALALVYFQLKIMEENSGIDLTTGLFDIVGKPHVDDVVMKKIKDNVIVI